MGKNPLQLDNEKYIRWLRRQPPDRLVKDLHEEEASSIVTHIRQLLMQRNNMSDPLGITRGNKKALLAQQDIEIFQRDVDKFAMFCSVCAAAIEQARLHNYDAVMLTHRGQVTVKQLIEDMELHKFLFA